MKFSPAAAPVMKFQAFNDKTAASIIAIAKAIANYLML